jgi:hypothetical protein
LTALVLAAAGARRRAAGERPRAEISMVLAEFPGAYEERQSLNPRLAGLLRTML